MARIFKPKFAKMRTVKGSNGKPVMVERVATKGKHCGKKIKVALREPVIGRNGKPVVAESSRWYVEYRTADDIIVRKPGYGDKGATVQLAARLEREAAQMREGIIDKYAEHRKKPLSKHLDDYEAHLHNTDCTLQHIKTALPRVRKVLGGCRAAYWSDLSPSTVQSFVALLRDKGLSIQTCNFYIAATKAFCSWLVRDGRFPDNPVARVQKGNTRTDRRHDRRSLAAEELRRLLECTRTAPPCHGMFGVERAMSYEFAVETGFRRKEILSLTPASFDLDDCPPTVTVAAAYSKHRREDVQPIRPEFAQSLRVFIADREDGQSVFALPAKTAVMLRVDLEVARDAWIREATADTEREQRQKSDFMAYRDSAGRCADFHALRHTFITNLTLGGAHPKDAQLLSRHSTISLTMDRYTHTARGQLASALESL